MNLSRFVLAILAPAIACALLAEAPSGQKLAKKYFEDTKHGFRLKGLDDQTTVPAQPMEEKMGLIAKMGGKEIYVNVEGKNVVTNDELRILRFAEKRNLDGGRDTGRSVAEEVDRGDILKFLDQFYKVKNIDQPVVDREKKIKGLVAHHRRWEGETQSFKIPLFLDVWSFELEDADVHLLYIAPQKSKKFLKVFEKSARTFQVIEREETLTLDKDASYKELLAYHEEDAERIPGWRALPTPSEKFIIKTSSKDRGFIKEVIDRLEKSRELYERDFPPPDDFKHVSIVRVCASEDEFHQYGGTSGGVAGWFNPTSTELVLYNSKNVDPNMTFAVMSHEAFHQYCHFLFGQSEAHRWFDEGHGDYYGGVDFTRGGKAEVGTRMPAGLNRLDEIKEMVREGSFKAVKDHVNFTHSQWQTQGPSNVSCYAQSWSIIYMLRQGTLGKVSKKVWKPEYANIIPNYVETLNAGFREAYKEIDKDLDRRRKKVDADTLKNLRRGAIQSKKDDIWKKAMEASWGQVDIDQFEEDWMAFVKDFL